MARVATLTKTNIPMNSKPMCAMKKFWMMLLAAVALTGCQKSEDVVADTNQITIKATMRFDAAARTTIKEQDGNYLARWTEEDKDNIRLVGISSDGGIWAIDAKDIHLENDGETATFEFAMYPEMMAESFTFVAVNRFARYGTNSEAVWLQLKEAQTQDGQNYYDAQADLVVSKPIPVEQLTGDLNLNFTMARMNALLKLSLKNFTLAEEEKIQSVTFACEQPLAGIITVNFADLDGVTYPIPYTLYDEESKSITFDLQAGGDLYISTLPATLKAGESYTVTVKTNQATYHKVATLPADLTLTAGDITSVAVNMGDATTETPITRFNDAYEYVIACKMADGKTYLMDRTPTAKNPAAVEATSLGLTIDNTTGVIAGQIPNKYRWRAKSIATETDGVYSAEFYYTLMGVTYNLIATSNAQGLAINSALAGAQTNPYVKELTVKTKGNGYAIMNTTGGASMYVNTTQGQFRFTAEHSDVVYFYRVNAAPQKELTVITESTNLMAGTYAVLYKTATGDYYALPNDTTISGEAGSYANTLPVAVPIDQVAIAFNDDGTVASANVADRFKWVISHRGNTSAYDLRSAVNMLHFLYMRDSSSGVAIGEHAAVREVKSSFMPDWTFAYDADKKLHGFVSTYERYLYVNTTNNNWAGATKTGAANAGGSLVFVYLSGSTEQL